jgi:arsenite methyltransferase
MTSEEDPKLKEHVRRTYAAAARAALQAGDRPSPNCCGPSPNCCGDGRPAPDEVLPAAICSCSGGGESLSEPDGPGLAQRLYGREETEALPPTAVAASLGCGNPLALVEIVSGETVLDLGSGGGLDVFLSARRVGPEGLVYGLDMTDEMLALAEVNREKAGLGNVRFLKGDIEAIPLPEACVDIVISNCVINLSLDKDQVFREAFRVLREGGRLAVSDIVFQGDISLLSAEIRQDLTAWAACLAGALEEGDYLARLKKAGFVEVALQPTSTYGDQAGLGPGLRVVSGFIRARKPAGPSPFRLSPAEAGHVQAVTRLLREAGLPVSGLTELISSADADDGALRGGLTIAAAGARRTVAGAAGLEVYGRDGLLRSVVVDPVWQGRGLARELVASRLHQAAKLGLRTVYLLTGTAAGYFSQLGFTPVDRSEAPQGLRDSPEFTSLCPDSTLMRRGLATGRQATAPGRG